MFSGNRVDGLRGSLLGSLLMNIPPETYHQQNTRNKKPKEGKGHWGGFCPLWNTKVFQCRGLEWGCLGSGKKKCSSMW